MNGDGWGVGGDAKRNRTAILGGEGLKKQGKRRNGTLCKYHQPHYHFKTLEKEITKVGRNISFDETKLSYSGSPFLYTLWSLLSHIRHDLDAKPDCWILSEFTPRIETSNVTHGEKSEEVQRKKGQQEYWNDRDGQWGVFQRTTALEVTATRLLSSCQTPSPPPSPPPLHAETCWTSHVAECWTLIQNLLTLHPLFRLFYPKLEIH